MNDLNRPPFYAPPTSDPSLLTRPTYWPRVIGLIGLCFGALAFLGGVFGVLAGNATRGPFLEMGVAPDFFERHSMYFKIIPGVSAAVAFILGLGCILLLLRKSASRNLILGWAVLKICFSLWQTPYSFGVQKELLPLQMKRMEQAGANNPALKAPDMDAAVDVMFKVMQVLTVAWFSALPIFMLIWFNRQKIKAEVANWKANEAQATSV